ncbi:endocuticle structural glycoprotein SgAbd-2 isoform X1 [Halyomorpha halys]|uniref:endocuticle structural glycoprotein SgAbd-2 isoform X1 n=1 Tax=Halyomorpha halys TaxID=286706 RepID=UPI0006D51267|nr:endocuticle structural glycoprotein SgAbd-2-like isoform X1 [Halyomorpha halys]KAE8573773.1 Cuticle Protein CPR RR-1 [Halyomorpha halys]
MKVVSIFLCSLVSAYAQVQQRPIEYPNNAIPIISYVNENNYDGSYKYSYETGDGISVQEEGFLKNPGVEGEEAQTARGTYSYTAPDGQVITVNWYADETGFHAEGAHIPSTSPPVLGPPVTVVPVGPLGPARPKPPDQNEPFEGVPIRPAAEFFRG